MSIGGYNKRYLAKVQVKKIIQFFHYRKVAQYKFKLLIQGRPGEFTHF
jgi:hypothetical protein